uniref:Uncharacterized protein n=1 Tax=Quercus lobata TaxID=97700 RepID=A0A7N2LSY4_QUELO
MVSTGMSPPPSCFDICLFRCTSSSKHHDVHIQLTSNAFLSFLINSHKFTPFTINSLVLLTIPSTLLIFNIGAVGLIHEVSSLFSNVISVLGLPVIPVLAVIFFHDKMDGVKAISMVLAIRGFISYFYQHYLDDSESKAEKRDVKEEMSMLPLLKEVTDEQDGLKISIKKFHFLHKQISKIMSTEAILNPSLPLS